MSRKVTEAILQMGIGRTNFGSEIENKVIMLALKKQVSQKPKNAKTVKFTGCRRPIFISGECPTCFNYVDTDDDPKFCSECGQKLEW